jgi:hypothetical protein
MRHSRFARGAGWSRTEWRGGSRNAARGGSLGARGRGFSSKKMVRVGETLYSKSGTALFKRDANSINDATRAACQQNSRGWKPRGVGRGIVRGRARYSWSRVHRGRGLPRSRGITKYSSRQRLFLGRGLARGGRFRTTKGARGAKFFKSKRLTSAQKGGDGVREGVNAKSFLITIGGCKYRRDAGSKHLILVRDDEQGGGEQKMLLSSAVGGGAVSSSQSAARPESKAPAITDGPHGGSQRMRILGVTYERSADGSRLIRCKPNKTINLKRQRQLEKDKLEKSLLKARKGKSKRNCLYFCHLGRCTREKCPYIHDPTKVAVCRLFLAGKCNAGAQCPLVHDLKAINPERIPVCRHFLESMCTRANCPYRHIKVQAGAYDDSDPLLNPLPVRGRTREKGTRKETKRGGSGRDQKTTDSGNEGGETGRCRDDDGGAASASCDGAGRAPRPSVADAACGHVRTSVSGLDREVGESADIAPGASGVTAGMGTPGSQTSKRIGEECKDGGGDACAGGGGRQVAVRGRGGGSGGAGLGSRGREGEEGGGICDSLGRGGGGLGAKLLALANRSQEVPAPDQSQQVSGSAKIRTRPKFAL